MEESLKFALVIIFLLLNVNLLMLVLVKRVFLFGQHVKKNENMSIFQLKMQCNRSFSLGNWYRKGEKGYTTAIVCNLAMYGGILWLLL
ncbi:hypothetical protein [Psychromonas sp. SP041]|uniref:hypothetical protein n=1 Tax=Psychromonas sp. SP041 TaxID=1365007 RepID=UPI0010C7C8CB|nr:hypothetical protein [Psychromonas sp. SP041]